MGFILSDWKLVIAGIMFAALLGTIAYMSVLRSKNNTLVAEKNTLVAELGVSQASVKSLMVAVEEQNTAVQKLKDDADERSKLHASEISAAQQKSAGYKKRADILAKQVAPQNISKCDAANQLFNSEIQYAK